MSIPKDPAEKIAYYLELERSGMGPLARSFAWGAPHGPQPAAGARK